MPSNAYSLAEWASTAAWLSLDLPLGSTPIMLFRNAPMSGKRRLANKMMLSYWEMA
jgi:hypothetical protein